MRMYDVILKKRNGGALSDEEIRWFIQGFVKGDIPDYQISALMMAIFFRGMNRSETHSLVSAMVNSGDRVDLSPIAGVKVDKHSTGGVGDKTSLVLAPLVAAAGVPIAKMSGRGLGHTGGTLDKLESITGFRVELSIPEFIEQVNRIGIAMAGQTGNLAPADKKLYALRDVTATVENLSLIAGSIMSKKLASGADAIVLDVKWGSGAFMKTPAEAESLAREMVAIGEEAGKKTVALITCMDQPLGEGIGNALEVKEAIATLRGEGPEDLHELCLQLGAEMLVLGKKASSVSEARIQLENLIQSGKAFQKMRQWVEAQGGDVKQIDNPSRLPDARYKTEVKAPASGYIVSVDAETIGRASMLLGAGRTTKDGKIDHAAGVVLKCKPGDQVTGSTVLAELHTSSEASLAAASELIRLACRCAGQKPEPMPLVHSRISADNL